jgi:hypothetical protein
MCGVPRYQRLNLLRLICPNCLICLKNWYVQIQIQIPLFGELQPSIVAKPSPAYPSAHKHQLIVGQKKHVYCEIVDLKEIVDQSGEFRVYRRLKELLQKAVKPRAPLIQISGLHSLATSSWEIKPLLFGVFCFLFVV